VVAENR